METTYRQRAASAAALDGLDQEEMTPRQRRDLASNRQRITRGQAPLDFETLANRVEAELRRRGRYAWHNRETVRAALGMTNEELKAALLRLLDQYRIEKALWRPEYRLNNARHVQAAR